MNLLEAPVWIRAALCAQAALLRLGVSADDIYVRSCFGDLNVDVLNGLLVAVERPRGQPIFIFRADCEPGEEKPLLEVRSMLLAWNNLDQASRDAIYLDRASGRFDWVEFAGACAISGIVNVNPVRVEPGVH